MHLKISEISRTRLQALIHDGQVKLNNVIVNDPSKKIKNKDEIKINSLEMKHKIPCWGYRIEDKLKSLLNFNNDEFNQFKIIVEKLGKAFVKLDASTIEINPLVLNKSGKLVLLDAKISLDDNALYRHPDLLTLKVLSEENEMELEAARHDMNYIKLDGQIGCMVNGAGLAMATMDIIKQFGKEPANFLDLGGTANKDRAIKGFKIIQSDPDVKSVFINIFGGIIHCDMIANGIIEAIKEINFKLLFFLFSDLRFLCFIFNKFIIVFHKKLDFTRNLVECSFKEI